MSLSLKPKLVSYGIDFLIASEREVAPESPIFLRLKSKLVNVVLTLILTHIQISQHGIDLNSIREGSSTRITSAVESNPNYSMWY